MTEVWNDDDDDDDGVNQDVSAAGWGELARPRQPMGEEKASELLATINIAITIIRKVVFDFGFERFRIFSCGCILALCKLYAGLASIVDGGSETMTGVD